MCVIVMAASTLYHDKSYLGDKFRRLRAKLGAPKAITATAHRLARIIWHLIVHRVPFNLAVFAAYEQANQIRRLKSLLRRLARWAINLLLSLHEAPLLWELYASSIMFLMRAWCLMFLSPRVPPSLHPDSARPTSRPHAAVCASNPVGRAVVCEGGLG
jgi:hypothetical protein